MQINLVTIGNSKGVVLSQALIKQCGFKNIVDVELVNHCLILKAPEQPRHGWENIFKSEAKEEDRDNIDMLALQNRWDEEEWEW
jgi:antitoxin MazE